MYQFVRRLHGRLAAIINQELARSKGQSSVGPTLMATKQFYAPIPRRGGDGFMGGQSSVRPTLLATMQVYAPIPHRGGDRFMTIFRTARVCIDQIYSLRRIPEQRHEFRRATVICFVYFAATFDSINRSTLWRLLREVDVPANNCDVMVNM